MYYIYPEVVESVRQFIQKRWPEKSVSCQRKENAWHQNRFIQISVHEKIDTSVIHYEYSNGYLELHLEGEYYGNEFNQSLYQYLRTEIDTVNTGYRWHNWFGMKQGLLRLESRIDDSFELADAITKFVSLIDPLVETFINSNSNTNIESTEIEDYSETLSDKERFESDDERVVLKTMTLQDVLSMNLLIPDYQRIYCWPQKNVEVLLDDIFPTQPRGHCYHLGTIILQRKDNGYDIIDGQQRTVTLALLLRALSLYDCSLLHQRFDSVEAQKYVGYNRYLIETYLNRYYSNVSKRGSEAARILSEISFDVLILQDSSLDLAYTFFSTQNARGKALTDYELLKSHHLRYIPETLEKQQRHVAKNWDDLLVKSERDNGDRSVSIILGIYVYCLRKWNQHKYWYIKEPNRVKNEFEAAPVIPEIPPFGERFNFMDPIQGGTHFFAFVNRFIQYYNLFIHTPQYRILWDTISCSGLLELEIDGLSGEKDLSEGKKRTHWWYGDVIATFLFAYYMKFGTQYLSEALTCITRIVSQLRYEVGKANKQSIMDKSCDLGIIQMLEQATSPTFFLAQSREIIRRLPLFDTSISGIRLDYFNKEMSLYEKNSKQYLVKDFSLLHNGN